MTDRQVDTDRVFTQVAALRDIARNQRDGATSLVARPAPSGFPREAFDHVRQRLDSFATFCANLAMRIDDDAATLELVTLSVVAADQQPHAG